MTIWCITGLDEERFAHEAYLNVARQFAVGARLVIVENGAGLGKWSGGGIVLRSEPGVTDYFNAGLAYAREHGRPHDIVAKIDSDDYYGPEYLLHIVHAIAGRSRVAVARPSIHVRTEAGTLLEVRFPVGAGDELGDDYPHHGPTLACSLGDALEMPEAPPEGWGEDAAWVAAMRDSGVRFVAAHHGDFAYCRHSGRSHAFPIGGDLVRHCWPDAEVFDLGPWDPAVVDGNRAPPQRFPVPFDPRRMADVADVLIDRVIKGAA